jgi:hypothetical protein
MSPQVETSYLVEHLRNVLAHDPRVGELDLHIELNDGSVVVTGHVPTRLRLEAISLVISEVVPGWPIVNAAAVTDARPPTEADEERLP